MVVGIAAAAVVLLIIIIVAAVCVLRKRRNPEEEPLKRTPLGNTPETTKKTSFKRPDTKAAAFGNFAVTLYKSSSTEDNLKSLEKVPKIID